MAPSRRLSQRISEGDGIAIIARVGDADSARTAQKQGAKAIAVEGPIGGIREATTLPVLWLGRGEPVDADAITIRPDQADDLRFESVMEVRSEDELEVALEQHDPEIFLISPARTGDDSDPLDAALQLLPDVPAGKLAIAECEVATRDEVIALERAGFDAVLVEAADVGALVGQSPPDV